MAVPDPASVIQLPWKKEVAWVAARATMEGSLVDQAPRNVLERLVREAATEGLRVKTGVEPEFFILNADAPARQTSTTPPKAVLRPAGRDATL